MDMNQIQTNKPEAYGRSFYQLHLKKRVITDDCQKHSLT